MQDLWSFWRLGLHCLGPFYDFWGNLNRLLQEVPIYFSYLGECCYTVLPRSSRNVLNFT